MVLGQGPHRNGRPVPWPERPDSQQPLSLTRHRSHEDGTAGAPHPCPEAPAYGTFRCVKVSLKNSPPPGPPGTGVIFLFEDTISDSGTLQDGLTPWAGAARGTSQPHANTCLSHAPALPRLPRGPCPRAPVGVIPSCKPLPLPALSPWSGGVFILPEGFYLSSLLTVFSSLPVTEHK